MWPDWVSNPGPLTYDSGVLPTALHNPAFCSCKLITMKTQFVKVMTISMEKIFGHVYYL